MATSTAPTGLPVVRAAGGIVLRSAPRGEEVMVVYRKRHRDWTLPKGKLRDGESFQDAAIREVEEETGCSCNLGSYVGTISYPHQGVPKVVMFWRMSVVEQRARTDNEEIGEAVWLPIAAAMERLTHAQERSLLARLGGSAKSAPPNSTSLNPPLASQAKLQDTAVAALPEPPPRSMPDTQQPKLAPGPSQSPASRPFKGDATQLLRELESFKIELAYLERRCEQRDESWVVAAHEHVTQVDRALAADDVEGARGGLDRARRYAVLGLNPEELAARAQILREEAANNSSWRAVAIQRLLAVSDDKLTAVRVADAMGLRDDNATDEKQAGRHAVHHVEGLVLLCLLGGALTISLLVAGVAVEMAPAVLLALVGAVISAGQMLRRRKREFSAPNVYSMLLTVALGSVAGLAAAPLCNYLTATFNLRPQPAWLPMGVALVLGYATQRFLVRFTVESRDSAIR